MPNYNPRLIRSRRSHNITKEDSPEAMIDARKFVMAIKMLKDKLYQDKF